MKKFPAACLLPSIALAVCGCVPDQEVAGPNQDPPEPAAELAGDAAPYEHAPVGMLFSDGHRITIHTGPEGPLYSVKGPGGQRLATEITPEEMQAGFPGLNLGELWAGPSHNVISEGTVPMSKNGFIHLERWEDTHPETESAYPLIFEPIPAPRLITQPATLAD